MGRDLLQAARPAFTSPFPPSFNKYFKYCSDDVCPDGVGSPGAGTLGFLCDIGDEIRVFVQGKHFTA